MTDIFDKPSPVTTMLDDERPIAAIMWDDESNMRSEVGVGEVTEIRAYGEPSHYGYVPWLAVYIGDEIVHRIPADRVRIVYDTAADQRESEVING